MVLSGAVIIIQTARDQDRMAELEQYLREGWVLSYWLNSITKYFMCKATFYNHITYKNKEIYTSAFTLTEAQAYMVANIKAYYESI